MGRLLALALGVSGYALLSHALMLHAAGSPWAIAVVLGPLVLTMTALAAWRRQWWGLAAMGGFIVGILVLILRGGVAELRYVYVAQHAGIHLALGWTFGSTLRRGGVPLITSIAARVHGDRMGPDMVVYTRKVTQAWVVYFVVMASLSLALSAWAPWPLWSWFANLGTPLAMVGLLWGEHALRYRLHPEFERVTVMSALRAYHTGALSGHSAP